MVDFVLDRLYERGETTVGRFTLDDWSICWSIEDVHRDSKIEGRTRIPAGRYPLRKITAGRYYEAYKERWGHEYAIGVDDVPGFTNIRIHTGNSHDDTSGCILTGSELTLGDTVSGSRTAYEKLYSKIRGAFNLDEQPYLIVRDDKTEKV